MYLIPPNPMKRWMRKAVINAVAEGGQSETEILDALSRLSNSHRAWVPTSFSLSDKVIVTQNERTFQFPRPLHKENNRTILRGYVESLHGKYQLSGFCEVKEGDIVIDCGAYIGGFALSVAPIAKQVVLIEPAPENYECCVANFANFENATVIQCGLFDKSMKFDLQLSKSDVDHSFLTPDRGATGRTISVPAKRLDDLCNELGLGKIDFLKLEAEGAEIEAVAGMGVLRPKKIAIDAGPERYGKSPAPELTAMLEKIGYEVSLRGNTLFAIQEDT